MRITSVSVAPTRASADSTLAIVWTVCSYGSPIPAIAPSASEAVQPATTTMSPARITRE